MVTQYLDKGHYLLSLYPYAAIHGLGQTNYNLAYTLLVDNIDNSLYTGGVTIEPGATTWLTVTVPG